MVIPVSSFYENMMGSSFQCYIPIFVEIDPSVLEKKILKGFNIHVYGRGGQLVMCPKYREQNLNFDATTQGGST